MGSEPSLDLQLSLTSLPSSSLPSIQHLGFEGFTVQTHETEARWFDFKMCNKQANLNFFLLLLFSQVTKFKTLTVHDVNYLDFIELKILCSNWTFNIQILFTSHCVKCQNLLIVSQTLHNANIIIPVVYCNFINMYNYINYLDHLKV